MIANFNLPAGSSSPEFTPKLAKHGQFSYYLRQVQSGYQRGTVVYRAIVSKLLIPSGLANPLEKQSCEEQSICKVFTLSSLLDPSRVQPGRGRTCGETNFHKCESRWSYLFVLALGLLRFPIAPPAHGFQLI